MRDELAALLQQDIPDRGTNVMVRCPFHEDRRPSLSLSLTKGVWYCHACGKGGGIRRLAQMLGGDLDAADLAVRTLRLEPDKPEPNFYDLWGQQRNAYEFDFKGTEVVNKYLVDRKLSAGVEDAFDFGWDERRGAIAMPYFDGYDKVVSIQYRYPDGSKSQETGGKRILYNVNDLRGARYVILAEGESDTHRLWSEIVDRDGMDIAIGGVPGAASGNKRWELWALDLLWAEKIYIAFDADEAGDKGAEQALRALGPKAIRLRPEGGKDWCDPLTNWSFMNDLP